MSMATGPRKFSSAKSNRRPPIDSLPRIHDDNLCYFHYSIFTCLCLLSAMRLVDLALPARQPDTDIVIITAELEGSAQLYSRILRLSVACLCRVCVVTVKVWVW